MAAVVVDTNVLLAATDPARSSHRAALAFLRNDERELAITPQIVREYLAVATRPGSVNGLGMSGAQAAANVDQFLVAFDLLAEGPGVVDRLVELVQGQSAAGKQIHDANVVASALAHGAVAIVTENVRHFARFETLIRIEHLGGSVGASH